MKFELAVATFVAFVVALLVFIAAFAVWTLGPWGCEARWPDREIAWSLGASCQVNVGGELVPERRVMVQTREETP
jgi:hypothetical protein